MINDKLIVRQESLLEYDHSENLKLELLGSEHEDSDDIFTFNANEIYITDPQERDGFDDNYGFEEDTDTGSSDYEGFGADDLFFPQKAGSRFSNDDKVGRIVDI